MIYPDNNCSEKHSKNTIPLSSNNQVNTMNVNPETKDDKNTPRRIAV